MDSTVRAIESQEGDAPRATRFCLKSILFLGKSYNTLFALLLDGMVIGVYCRARGCGGRRQYNMMNPCCPEGTPVREEGSACDRRASSLLHLGVPSGKRLDRLVLSSSLCTRQYVPSSATKMAQSDRPSLPAGHSRKGGRSWCDRLASNFEKFDHSVLSSLFSSAVQCVLSSAAKMAQAQNDRPF